MRMVFIFSGIFAAIMGTACQEWGIVFQGLILLAIVVKTSGK